MDSNDVIQANIEVHAKLAKDYSRSEPHFRPENTAKVTKKISRITKSTEAKRALDLGCGTGFMINILKKLFNEVVGVDITQAMLDQVDKSGQATIRLHRADTGTFEPEKGAYDLVTAYSFLHHLFDVNPTLETAYKALRPGGQFFVGLEPNYYFWEAVRSLDRNRLHDEIVAREVRALDEEETVATGLGVSKEVLRKAEYSKSVKGGFREEELAKTLSGIGFKNIRVEYDWFLGEAAVINDPTIQAEQRFLNAAIVDAVLKRQMPLSRHLFKYLFVYAER